MQFVQSNSQIDDTSDTTATVTLTGVVAGNLIVLFVKYEGDAGGNATVSASDGTSSFTARPINHHGGNNDLHCLFLYLLVGNSGSRTYTVTWTGSVPWKWLHVREYSYTGTCSFDVDNVTAEGTSASNPTSGTITTTGTDEVVIGGVGEYGSQTYASPLIGGSAAGNAVGAGTAAYSFDRILTGTMTNGTATVSDTNALDWLCSVISFKATESGATTLTPGAGSLSWLGRALNVSEGMSNDGKIVISPV